MNRFLVIANWKQNGERASNQKFLSTALAAEPWEGIEVIVCPPLVYIAQLSAALAESFMALGSQQVSDQRGGAYTGEVSAAMLADFGCKWVVVGHSERRLHYGENEGHIARKLQAVCDSGMTPVLCVGETLEQHSSGEAMEAVDRQLQVLQTLSSNSEEEQAGEVVIAYEPVWAIGSGRLPTPDDIEGMHGFIKSRLEQLPGKRGRESRVAYGGSVNCATAPGLLALDHVAGVLVGGASLQADSFIELCSLAAQTVSGRGSRTQ